MTLIRWSQSSSFILISPVDFSRKVPQLGASRTNRFKSRAFCLTCPCFNTEQCARNPDVSGLVLTWQFRPISTSLRLGRVLAYEITLRCLMMSHHLYSITGISSFTLPAEELEAVAKSNNVEINDYFIRDGGTNF